MEVEYKILVSKLKRLNILSFSSKKVTDFLHKEIVIRASISAKLSPFSILKKVSSYFDRFLVKLCGHWESDIPLRTDFNRSELDIFLLGELL